MVFMARHSRGRRRFGRGARTSAPRVGAALAAPVVVAASLAGCTGEPASSSEAPEDQPTAAGLELAASWPLTGLPNTDGTVRHRVMVVKIDNTASSSPQVGLRRADLVTEELVEGGSTRLAAFYDQHTPRLVGPVRSMRATDIGVVKPAAGVLVAAGGAPPTVRRIRSAGISSFGEGAPGFRRDHSRSAPYNLFVDLATLAGTIKKTRSPGSYLPWGTEKDLPRGEPARGLSAVFSGAHTTRWRFHRGRYVDLNSFATAGDEFRPDTVLVLRVKVGDAGYVDPAGNPVPETKFTGRGKALIFHSGRVVRATWAKELDTTLTLAGRAGQIRIPPGHVWIELVPAKGGDVTVVR
jgi:hypothetical protein